jgi:F-type H+-transporting ATPase subunit delta
VDFVHFLWSVIDFSHTRKLKTITQHFLQLCQEHLHISYFQVTSAYQLSDQEMKELKCAIIQKFHKQKIILRNTVDKTVIGGIKIKSHSYCIDNTLKNKLNLMRDNIKNVNGIRR